MLDGRDEIQQTLGLRDRCRKETPCGQIASCAGAVLVGSANAMTMCRVIPTIQGPMPGHKLPKVLPGYGRPFPEPTARRPVVRMEATGDALCRTRGEIPNTSAWTFNGTVLRLGGNVIGPH